MPYLNRDGAKIYYEEAGDGPVVLLSHGFSATSQMWTRQVSALKDGYRVITWDMRGHGQTDSPSVDSAYSEEATVEDMSALLEATGTTRAVIAGLSLGGYMSLAFHLRYPASVRALMLFDTGPGFRNDEARAAWNRRAQQWSDGLMQKGLAALETLASSREMKVSVHRSASGLAAAARGMLSQFDSRIIDSLPSVTVPTLVLVGSSDTNFIAPADYMAKKIPGARKVVIPDAGHSANLDQPEAFNREVRAFLDCLGS